MSKKKTKLAHKRKHKKWVDTSTRRGYVEYNGDSTGGTGRPKSKLLEIITIYPGKDLYHYEDERDNAIVLYRPGHVNNHNMQRIKHELSVKSIK